MATNDKKPKKEEDSSPVYIKKPTKAKKAPANAVGKPRSAATKAKAKQKLNTLPEQKALPGKSNLPAAGGSGGGNKGGSTKTLAGPDNRGGGNGGGGAKTAGAVGAPKGRNEIAEVRRASKPRNKFMGMVDEVKPKALPGPAAKAAKSGIGKQLIRLGGRLAGPLAIASMAIDAKKALGAVGEEAATKEKERKGPENNVRNNIAPKSDLEGFVRATVKTDEPAPKAEAPKAAPKKKGKELSAFEKAFASARKKGESVFEFNGKKYHTRRKDDKKKESVTPQNPKDAEGLDNLVNDIRKKHGMK